MTPGCNFCDKKYPMIFVISPYINNLHTGALRNMRIYYLFLFHYLLIYLCQFVFCLHWWFRKSNILSNLIFHFTEFKYCVSRGVDITNSGESFFCNKNSWRLFSNSKIFREGRFAIEKIFQSECFLWGSFPLRHRLICNTHNWYILLLCGKLKKKTSVIIRQGRRRRGGGQGGARAPHFQKWGGGGTSGFVPPPPHFWAEQMF